MSFCCASHFVVFPLYFLSQLFIFVHLGSTAYFDIVMSQNTGAVENANIELEKAREKLEKRETELEEAKKGKSTPEETAEAKIGVAKAEIGVAKVEAGVIESKYGHESPEYQNALSALGTAQKQLDGLVSGMFLF